MQMVGADWLSCDRREDDLSSRPGSIVQVYSFSFVIVNILLLLEISYHMCFEFMQQYAAKGGPEFFFVINIQVSINMTLFSN